MYEAHSTKRLNSKQVIDFLKRNEYNYVEQYYQEATIFDDEGYDRGRMSEKVFDNLLEKCIIKMVGRNEMFWHQGYYKLTNQKK